MITFEKETGRIVKWLDRDPGPGSVWEGLRAVHFANGSIVPVESVGTLSRCPRIPPGARPMIHADACPYNHPESCNPHTAEAQPSPPAARPVNGHVK